MRKIIAFFKKHSTKVVLVLAVFVVIGVLHLIYHTIDTNWVRVPSIIAAPLVLFWIITKCRIDQRALTCDTEFYTWVICMVIALLGQISLTYHSWWTIGIIIWNALIGFVGIIRIGAYAYGLYD